VLVSTEAARVGTKYCGGIGGGMKCDMKTPISSERCGDGARIVGGGGL
jgi:hypothetical protein